MLLCVLLVSALVDLSLCEVYSSAAEMKEVFSIERQLVDVLDSYAATLKEKLARINSYMEEFSTVMSERDSVATDAEFYDRILGNPIHAYKMMKRFSVDLKRIEAEMKKDDWTSAEFEIRRKRLGSVIPKEEDLHGAAQALIRLQEVYELDIRDLANGDLGHGRSRFVSNAGLTAQDCLFMGKHCFNSGALARSLEWFEEAWIMAGQEGNRTLKQDQVQQFLDHAAKTHDQKVLAGEKSKELFPKPVYEEPPFQQREKMYALQREKLRGDSSEVDVGRRRNEDDDHKDDGPRFNALCRGEELRPSSYVARLKCYFSDRGDPYYLLHPTKVEMAHMKPEILVFHDVISPKEMQTIKDLAAPIMMRSQVQGKKPGNSEVSMTRTSKTGWLQDSFDPLVQQLSQKIHWMTGLNTNTWNDDAELLQVANYLNGGHYNPHHDYVMKDREPDHMIMVPHKGLFIGDRIATWMFYMSDVPAGGRTAFPRIGVSVAPVAGTAVFWYNLMKSGAPDRDTLHGACPILYGTKWVSNKWIREGSQIFTRPCGLSREE